MLNIIEGGFFSGAHEYVIERISELVKKGERAIFIVPEQQTVIREAEMTDLLPESAPLFFELTNFTRLSDTVFRTVGGIDGEHLDRTRRALVMWGILTRLARSGEISVGGEISAGLVDKTLAAVADMDSAGVDAEKLIETVKSLGTDDKRLITKMTELGKIMSEFRRVTEERYVGGANDIAAMARMLENNPGIFSGTRFFIEGFTSFTESQYKTIALLARECEVYVHLVIPKAMRGAFEYSEMIDTEQRLVRLARDNGFYASPTHLDGCAHNPFIAEYVKQIWRTSPKIDHDVTPYGGEVEIVEAKNPFDECDFVAEDIRRRIKEGERFSDIAIIARRAESYDGIIDRALDKAHVPYFYSRKRDAESFKPIKLIHAAYNTILYGFRTEDVVAYAKCTPGELARDECDEFELYVKTWQIKGRQLTSGEPFDQNPDGYTSLRADNMAERLVALSKTKERLTAPLLRLLSAARNAKTVGEHATALVAFLKDINLPEAIEREVAELVRLGEASAAEEYDGLWGAICRALDILVVTAKDEECTTDSFHARLKIALSSMSIGRIPSFLDSVIIGSADSIHLRNKKHIYILGLNRQEFPEAVADNGYFSEKDKLKLSTLDLNIHEDKSLRGAKELFIFLRAVSYANDSLTLLYTKKSAGGADTPPSDVIAKTVAMIGKDDERRDRVRRISTLDIPAEDRIHTPEGGLDALGKLSPEKKRALCDALEAAGLGNMISVADGRITNDKLELTPSENVAKAPLALTQSIIEDYNSCPLLHFLKHKLRLAPERRAEFDARNIGTFIHAVIEGFFNKVKRDGLAFSAIDNAMAESITRECAKDYIDTLENDGRSAREELLLSRLCEASLPVIKTLRDEFSTSKFEPRFFELSISEGKSDKPEPVKFKDKDGNESFVYGTIDRVDTYEGQDRTYVRIIDYKTGEKTLSRKDIEEGKNLQMFLYLKSITDSKNEAFLKNLGASGKPEAAGVEYLNVNIKDVKVYDPSPTSIDRELAKAQQRVGLILNDPEVLTATGKDFAPLRITAKGAIHASDLAKSFTSDEWEDMTRTIEGVIGDISSRMRRGDICAKPSEADACTYCDFKALCRSAK